MLVLSRRIGEEIIINGNIRIKVTSIDRNKVRLGIQAPKDTPIFRSELLEEEQPSAKYQEAVPHKPIPDPEALDGKW